MLRWVTGNMRNDTLRNECICKKLDVALIEDKVRKTHQDALECNGGQ